MSTPPLRVFTCPLDGVTLIEASAGTGKTWNLCGLYLRLLLEKGLLVDQILVVTFTRAATAELRERIRGRLQDALLALALPDEEGTQSNDPFIAGLFDALTAAGRFEPATLKTQLADALLNFDLAAITTIHGFCQRALADLPFAAGQPFDLALQPDDSALLEETAADFWRSEVVARIKDAGLLRYLVSHGLTPDNLARQIRRRATKPLARLIWPEQTGAVPPDSDAIHQAYETARRCWQREAATVRSWLLDNYKGRLHGATYKPESIGQAFADWDAHFANGHSQGELGSKAALITRQRIIEKTTGKQDPLHHVLFDVLDDYAQRWLARQQYWESQRLQLLQTALVTGLQRLSDKKAASHQLAYDDLLTLLHRALTEGQPPELAARLRERFPAALIDEFQDTDPLQFGIFRHIYVPCSAQSPSGPLFLIGDPKQAIYGFRNADIFTYLNAKSLADRHATLGENQRSTPALITGVNALFSTNPAAFALADFPAFTPVSAGAKPRHRLLDPLPPAGDLVLWHLPLDEAGNALDGAQARREAIAACAREIARLLGGVGEQQIQLQSPDGQCRPLAAADIAILVRSHSQGAAMKMALSQLKIGSIELSQASVFDSEEAAELQILLTALCEPGRTDYLLAALATRLGGHDAHAIAAMAEQHPDAQQATRQLTHYQQTFFAYREMLEQRGFAVFWRQFAVDFSLTTRLFRLPDGERRLTNLNHLAELIGQGDAGRHGAQALLRWLNHACMAEDKAEIAQLRLESDANLVQIVTVHKSKGLEYPVIFAPFLWRMNASAGSSSQEGREYHADDGTLCIDFVPDSGKEASRLEDFAEQVRLIYVALTRAVNRAYLIVGPYTQSTGRGSPSTTQSARSVLNWLAAWHPDGLSAAGWLENKASATEILASWQSLAEKLPPGSVDFRALPDRTAHTLNPHLPQGTTLRTPPLPELSLPVWRNASFSSLNHSDIPHQDVRPDYDARPDTEAEGNHRAPSAEEMTDDDILLFPRGAAAGEIIHAVLEKADFQDTTHWDNLIRQVLSQNPQGSSGQHQARMLRNMLGDVLQTPLPDGFRLADIPASQRIAELEFSLPCHKLSATRLNALLAEHHIDQPELSFRTLEGYLGGFIDLVFTHRGRYYLADWKSNHLGQTAVDYGPVAMASAMRHHGYHLQYLLYTVALHRHLGRHVADYDYRSHFGGAYYFFIRGMRPQWQPTEPGSPPCGIALYRPAAELITALDAMLG